MYKVHSSSSLTDRKLHFLKRARETHGNKYDYSEIEYISTKKPIKIICKIHGPFMQYPTDHLKGYGCSKCSKKYKPSTAEWIERARAIHNDEYNYSKVIYKDNKTPVCIICSKHGEFWQIPNNHIKGTKCPKCELEDRHTRQAKSTDQFIHDAIQVHGERYNYSKVNYYNKNTKVCIICHEHGEFWQSAGSHLSGSGCPMCKKKNQTELYYKLKNVFNNEEILYEFKPKWLNHQHFDLYFPKYNIAIEYDGQQHFVPIKIFGGDLTFKDCVHRDRMKNNLAINNKCVLIRIKYDYSVKQFETLVSIIKNVIDNNVISHNIIQLY